MRLIELHVNSIDLKKFEEDCKPWLDAIRGTSTPAYHGTKNYPKDWEIRKALASRAPRDTPGELNDIINDFFEKKFNWRARENGMFVTGHSSDAYTYGKPCVIFPIGKFESLWSPEVRDLTSIYIDHKSALRYGPDRMDADVAALKAIGDAAQGLKHSHWYHNEELVGGLTSSCEIIIRADSYYFFRHDETYYDTVRPFLLNEGYLIESKR
jgi:hypothetical protein